MKIYESYPYPAPSLYPIECMKRDATKIFMDITCPVFHFDQWKMSVPDKPRTLIVGCGTVQANIAARQCPESKITAIDESLPSIDISRRTTKELGYDNIEYIHADFNKWKSSERFDTIVASGVMHHVMDHHTFMENVHEHLNPRGIYSFMVYNAKGRECIQWFHNNFTTPLRLYPCKEDIQTVRDVLEYDLIGHPCHDWYIKHNKSDEEIADTWLNPYFVHYTEDSIHDLVSSYGFMFAWQVKSNSIEDDIKITRAYCKL